MVRTTTIPLDHSSLPTEPEARGGADRDHGHSKGPDPDLLGSGLTQITWAGGQGWLILIAFPSASRQAHTAYPVLLRLSASLSSRPSWVSLFHSHLS